MRFTDFDAILFDMDGTLYRERQGLPGAARVIAHLQQTRRTFACVTNNSANTAQELSQRLAAMGISVPPSGVYTSCHAMVDWILQHSKGQRPRPRIFNFAGASLPADLGDRAEFVERIDDPCDVVAVGTHFRENGVGFDLERAVTGLNLLRRGAHMVVGSADRVFPIVGGGVEFGSGSWGALYAYATDLPPERAHYVGKPSAEFFGPLLRRLNVAPGRCLIVGDNLESDILGGKNAAMATALVLTGITHREHLASSSIRPDAVFENMDTLLDALR